MCVYSDIRKKVVDELSIIRRPVTGLLTSYSYKGNRIELWYRLTLAHQECVDGICLRSKDAVHMFLDFYDAQIDAYIPDLKDYKVDVKCKCIDDCVDVTVTVITNDDVLDVMHDYTKAIGMCRFE